MAFDRIEVLKLDIFPSTLKKISDIFPIRLVKLSDISSIMIKIFSWFARKCRKFKTKWVIFESKKESISGLDFKSVLP